MEEKNVRCEWKHRIKAGKMLVIRAGSYSCKKRVS